LIGEQVWMAENLNREVEGSKCYDNEPANCEKYGRLYYWATAMKISDNYNLTSFNPDADTKYKGVCPKDWHIPSSADWNVLMEFVSSCSYDSGCIGAETKLRATSEWEPYGETPVTGTDEFGFSALPGGSGFYDNDYSKDISFSDVGSFGGWWSAHEDGGEFAYYRFMNNKDGHVGWNNLFKYYLRSVRCVKDN